MRQFFIALTRNPLSLAGAGITTASAILIISLFALEVVGFRGSSYLGILAFLILPALFVVGLVLIPIGIRWERKRQARGGETGFPVLDFNRSRVRNVGLIVLGLTAVNIVILSTATYKGVEVMESTEFCGETCHSVMAPEFTTYQTSPHARVACVDCHIGAGASWFVKSKLSGAWQVVSVAFDLYEQPIPTPVHNLRPARETCEQCHWPSIFVGDRLKVLPKFEEDEENTELKTVLLLRVGGVEGRKSHGIHWHVDPGVQIRYRSDETRHVIGDVEMSTPDGPTKLFKAPEGLDESIATGEWRTMDCVDCHNRPTHIYKTPERALNDALAEGLIDRHLPFIRREGLAALTAEYASQEAAATEIPARITAFYQENYPELLADGSREAIGAAGAMLGELHNRYVHPSMKITWGTYPSHIGHEDFPGCFRCHDEDHATEEGETISQDCSTCHSLLAMEEEDPAILTELEP